MSCERYPQDLNNVQYISNTSPHLLQLKLEHKFSQEEYIFIVLNSRETK